jgi:replicative DNA helicase
MSQETLEQFGSEFQSKVLAALLQDRSFVEQTLDMISAEYFESDSTKWIVTTIVEYFGKYRKVPTPQVFKIELQKVSSEVTRVAVQQQLRSVGRHLTDSDLAYVKDKFLQFCKNQKLKSAILKSVELLETHQYDGIKTLIDEALRAGQSRDFGHDWKKDIDKRLSVAARKTIATPWDCINGVMDGGLGPGELGAVMAPTGAGKSWMLAAQGAKALKDGLRVLHFTLELNDCYTGLRYDTIFTGIEPKELRHNYEKVKATIDKVPGQIVIKYFPSRTVNANRLFAHIRQMDANGFKPDLLIIDYADLMISNRRVDTRYEQLGAIYLELRSLAGELNIPCWTASQTQRSSISDEIIQADKIAESFQKVMTADFVMSLSRTLEDKAAGTARVHIIKNRFGPDGITFPAQMNVIRGQIEIFDDSSLQGMRMRQAMQEGSDIVRKMLHDKLKSQ